MSALCQKRTFAVRQTVLYLITLLAPAIRRTGFMEYWALAVSLRLDAGRRAAQVGKLRHDFRVGERGIDGRLRQMLIGSRGARVQPRVLPYGCGSLQTTVGQVDVNSSRPIQEMCCQAAARRKSAFPYQSVDKSKMG